MGKRSATNGKAPRSRQNQSKAAPLKERIVREKEDEELELEERLFGTKRRRIAQPAQAGEEEDAEGAFGELDDDQLFTIDAPVMDGDESEIDYEAEDDVSDIEEDDEDEDDLVGGEAGPSRLIPPGGAVGESDDEDADADEDEGDNESDFSQEGADDVDVLLPDEQYDVAEQRKADAVLKKIERKCVWHDPADDMVGVDLEEVRRLKKLARGKKDAETQVGGAELQNRLREQFERLHPRPEWADNRVHRGVPSLSSLFASTKSFIDSGSANGSGSRGRLPQGTVEMRRQRNANQANPSAGKREFQGAGEGVVDFAWHPNSAVPVGAVAGGDRRVRFFHIDGETNPTLLTLHIPSLPLKKISYHPTGSSLLLTGNRPYYYTYDLAAQKCLRSARNLFGSDPSPSAPKELSRHAFSPDGSLLAVAGRRGAVSVLDWSTSGTGAVVAELISGRGGLAADLQWSADGAELEVLGGANGSEVERWDVGQRRVVGRWSDDRAYGGSIMRRSKSGEYTAIGSSTGIVNLYSTASFSTRGAASSTSVPYVSPEPLKSLEHLTTAISSLDFHPLGEMLVAATKSKPKALKMYHLPSATAFSNWPTQNTPLYRVTTTNFSPSGEYLTVGNQRGQVLLWSLNHYSR